MQFHQLRNGVIVGDDESFEFPFPTQNFLQQPFVGVRRYSVNLIIRSHHAHDAGFGHGGFEAWQEELAQHSLGIIRWSDVGSPFRLTVRREVFCRRDDVIAID